MPTTQIRILIVEDHAVVRQGLKMLIQADPGLRVSAEAEDGHAAILMAEHVRPDVVIMDVAMPGINGVEATRQIKRHLPGSHILALSSYSDDDSVRKVMDAGATGYITKHSASEDLLEGIRQVHTGRQYFSPRIARRLKRQKEMLFMGGNVRRLELTPREVEVIKLIAQGKATRDVAVELRLSHKTVEKHRQSLMNKLDIHEVAGLTRYAAAKGWLGSVGI